MIIPSHVFKAYDIRGLAEKEITEDFAYRLGRAFVIFLKEKGVDLKNKKIVSGHDMRATSPILQKSLIKGLVDGGAAVVDIGLASTPLFNFACAHYPEHVGGITVTASHNPAQYNGFKITLGDGLPVGAKTGMDRIKDLVVAGDFQPIKEKGGLEKKDIYEDYEKKIFGLVDIKKIKPLKLVIDAGNGMAKVTLPKILKHLPLEVEYLFLEPDGNFPNHESNPLKTETLKELQKKVLENKADFGFALDGDADRVGLVDELGQVVPASFVGALVGLEVLKKYPGGLMFYDLRCSRAVKEVWEKAGAKTDICQVGHANIKVMMKERGAVFASELSLHQYFCDTYDLEAPDLSLLYILEILSREPRPLSVLWQTMDVYSHSGEINFKIENKEEVLEKLLKKYSDATVDRLDGLLFTYPDWWFNVRVSNTEPVLRLNLETNTKEMMAEKLTEVKNIIIG